MPEIWRNIIVAMISALLAILIQQYYFDKQSEIKNLDILKQFDTDYLSKPKFPNSKVEISVDGKPKDSIGLLEISLINYTREAYKDLPILIRVKPQNISGFKYFSHFAVGEKNIKDLVSETKKMKFDGESYTFYYSAKSLNRTETSDIAMKLGIFFEGNQEPEVDVSTPGLNTRQFSIENSPSRWKVKRDAFIIVSALVLGVFIVTFFLFSPALSFIFRPLDRRSNKRYAKQIFDAIRDEKLHSNLDDDQLIEYVAKMLYKRQINWWNQKTLLGKWAMGMRRPEESDYRMLS